MSFTIDVAFREEFGSTVFEVAEQRISKFRPHVAIDTGVVGRSKDYDRIAGSDMVQSVARHEDTPFTPVEHTRRRVSFIDFKWSEIIDNLDKVKTLIDPANAYTRAAARALGRRIDQTTIDALDGNATAVDNAGAGSTVGFAAGQIVAVDYVESGAAADSNLTVPKVREARRLFMTNDVPDDEDLFFSVSGSALMSLMRDDEVTSSDFGTLQALMRGTIEGVQWMGFNWLRTELLPTQTGNIRRCYAGTRRGLQLSFNLESRSDMGPDPSKSFNTRVYLETSLAAVRMDEVEIVRVLADEDL